MITRRDFLVVLTSGAAGTLLVACSPSGQRDQGSTTAPTPERSIPNEEQAVTSEPPGSEPAYSKDVIITPTDDFYTQTYLAPAVVDVAAWSLTIDGLVNTPLTVRYDDLLGMEQVTEMRTLECIGNPIGGNLIGNATWTGVRLKPLLDEAGIQPEAIRARFDAADGYTTAVDVEWIVHEDALLVHAMNDAPLTEEHGYPLRLMIPGLYGQKMPKWLTGIEFIDHDFEGYWEKIGWSDVAIVQTNSKIVLPPALSEINGTVALQGWAYAGTRRITSIEVQVDDGEWTACQLLEGPSTRVWTQWWMEWSPPGTGSYQVSVRATDDAGFTQSERAERPLDAAYPDGSSAIHSAAYPVNDTG